jgi:large subunit ribosomal protein L10
MSKKLKAMISEELRNQFTGVESLLVISSSGIDAISTNAMRGDLRSKQIKFTVVKNSLTRRVFDELGIGAVNKHLDGPSAICHGGESIVNVAKELAEWNKKVSALTFRGGLVEGAVIDAAGADALSRMPSREELIGEAVVLAQSPGRRIAGQVAAPASRIAGCVKALIENLEAA